MKSQRIFLPRAQFSHIVVAGLVLLQAAPLCAQQLGSKEFTAICTELERLDRYWQAKQKMPYFEIRTDTVRNEEWIEFADGTGKRIKGKTGNQELYNVAHARSLPVFPLTDTFCIADTLGVLQQQDLLLNGHYFYVHKCAAATCRERHANAGCGFVKSYRTLGLCDASARLFLIHRH